VKLQPSDLVFPDTLHSDFWTRLPADGEALCMPTVQHALREPGPQLLQESVDFIELRKDAPGTARPEVQASGRPLWIPSERTIRTLGPIKSGRRRAAGKWLAITAHRTSNRPGVTFRVAKPRPGAADSACGE
jgi:hypothetical protein